MKSFTKFVNGLNDASELSLDIVEPSEPMKLGRIITAPALAANLTELGIIPRKCKEFTIKITPGGVVELTALCFGTEELLRADWSVLAPKLNSNPQKS